MEYRKIQIEETELQTKAVTNEGRNEVIGYASLYEHRSRPLTQVMSINGTAPRPVTFVETIKRGAFDKANMSEVIYTIDHNPEKLLARTGAKNLELMVTEKGLMFRAILPNTTIANDLIENINVGNYNENSFQFSIDKDSWEVKEGVLHRSINSFDRIADVSTVVMGAYSDTQLAVRSITVDGYQSEEPAPIEVVIDEPVNDAHTIDLDFAMNLVK